MRVMLILTYVMKILYSHGNQSLLYASYLHCYQLECLIRPCFDQVLSLIFMQKDADILKWLNNGHDRKTKKTIRQSTDDYDNTPLSAGYAYDHCNVIVMLISHDDVIKWRHFPPVNVEFPAQRPVTRSFDVFFDMRLDTRLSKHSRGWWFETPSRPLWRH